MTSPVDQGDLPIAMDQVYAQQMRIHAVMLIWLAYRRLDAASLAKSQEDDITGEMKRKMKEVTQDPSSPGWVDYYEIGEQVRQNVGKKRGKKRPIMDIEMERHCRGTRPHLGFEAKPLKRGKSIGAFLGEKGLAAFFSGYYPTTHGDAGMLAYVQDETSDQWSKKLAKQLSSKAKKHRVAKDGQLQPFNAEEAMPAFRSGHVDKAGKPLFVIHVFLAFLKESSS
jgi:hypothetical protein